MRFAPPKCKRMPQDWVEATPNLSIKGQFIERVDKFTYLGSCITPDGSIAEELSLRIQKARLALSNFHHLRRRNDIKLSTGVGYTQWQCAQSCCMVESPGH